MMLGEELSRHFIHDWEQERALIQTARLRLLIERRALASEPPTPAIERRISKSASVTSMNSVASATSMNSVASATSVTSMASLHSLASSPGQQHGGSTHRSPSRVRLGLTRLDSTRLGSTRLDPF